MPPMMAALLLRRHLQLVRLGLQLMLLIVLRMWYDRPVHMVSRVVVAGTRESASLAVLRYEYELIQRI